MSIGGEDVEVVDEELEMIKRRKMAELARRAEQERARREREAAEEAVRQELLRRILTPEARERLANLRLVRPELVKSLEDQLIVLAQSGRIKIPITDEELKTILQNLFEKTRRDIRINIREKGW
ncbi:MAG: DNA-binding protein [Desulfurococcales archaeon]|jgi:programmed cell death protein 5|nr:DNA-binding protein [Desulfurococcales archaeon]